MWDEGVQESWTERVKELYADKMMKAQVPVYSLHMGSGMMMERAIY